MALYRLLLITLVSSLVLGDADSESYILVQTKSGRVRGKIMTGFTNQSTRAFVGIPYAEPPIGKLRFKPPVPVSPWTEVFDATRTSLSCYQTYTKELLDLHRTLEIEVRRPWSEDCLTLNIWAPKEVSDNTPVVIFIHGEEFQTGTGEYPYLDLTTHSAETQTVSMSINYRLGAFGFLSLGTSDVPGNLGLMDQHVALKWVYDNIQAFGGKASAIFLSGFGAGAASVGHQIILEQNSGLFRTGLLVSGSPTCPWSWQTKEEAMSLGKSLVLNLGCQNASADTELECLQKLHPEDIVDASILEAKNGLYLFKPNVDGTFIKEPPVEAMKAGRFNNITVIAVNSATDSAVYFYNLNKDLLTEQEGLTDEGFVKALKRGGLVQSETELELIRSWYLNKSCHTKSTDIRDQAVQAYSDAFTGCCTSGFIDSATEASRLSYRISFSLPDPKFPAWMGSHSLSSFAVLVAETLNPESKYGPKAKQDTLGCLRTGRKFYREKAKEFQQIVPLYNLKDRPYLDWGTEYKHLKGFRTRECELWNNILPKIRSRKV